MRAPFNLLCHSVLVFEGGGAMLWAPEVTSPTPSPSHHPNVFIFFIGRVVSMVLNIFDTLYP